MGNIIQRSKDNSNNSGSVFRSFTNNLILRHKDKNLFDKYEIIGKLDSGSISEVFCIKRKDTKEEKICVGCIYIKKMFPFLKTHKIDIVLDVKEMMNNPKSHNGTMSALKRISLKFIDDDVIEEFRNEVDIIRKLDHPNIVKMFETYESFETMSIVMELCSGGNLNNRAPYKEEDARRIIFKIVSAVSYLHENNIIHRDIKLENIMFESNDPFAEVKLIDFGLSKMCSPPNKKMHRRVGSLYTMSPQVLEGNYTNKADIWSIGIVSFILLSNTKPFDADRSFHMMREIFECNIKFEKSVWKNISNEAKCFVQALLERVPDLRLNAKEALASPWIRNRTHNHKSSKEFCKSESFCDCFEKYLKIVEFKKIALMLIAYKSNADDIFNLRQTFIEMDADENGRISFDEFKEALKDYKYSDKDLNAMFQNVDIAQDGYINYTEFLAATLESEGLIDEIRIKEAFEHLDFDNSGSVSKQVRCIHFLNT